MTAFAFILGCIPLLRAAGAGAASRVAIGAVVVFGMLMATFIGIFLTPGLFVLVERLKAVPAATRRRRSWLQRQGRGDMKHGLVVSMALAVVSCSVGPDFTKPDLKAPEAHREQEAQARSLADLPWWKVFQDPVLAGYLEDAVTKGFDVRVAAANVENARAYQRAAFWAFFHTFGVGVGLGGGQGFPGVPTIVPPTPFNGNLGAYGGASWEVDVWGRLRRQKEAADALV